MKFLKKFLNIFFVIGLLFSFSLVVSAEGHVISPDGDIISIAYPNNQSDSKRHIVGRYYVAERQGAQKFYVEQRNVDNDGKEHGAFIERVEDRNYLIYDDLCSSEQFTHIIKKIDDDNYMVGMHYPENRITPILKITRDLDIPTNWYVKSLNTYGRICMPSTEAYIEKQMYYNTWFIRSAVDSPDISRGAVYNCVTTEGTPDEEFSTIINFFATFIFK